MNKIAYMEGYVGGLDKMAAPLPSRNLALLGKYVGDAPVTVPRTVKKAPVAPRERARPNKLATSYESALARDASKRKVAPPPPAKAPPAAPAATRVPLDPETNAALIQNLAREKEVVNRQLQDMAAHQKVMREAHAGQTKAMEEFRLKELAEAQARSEAALAAQKGLAARTLKDQTMEASKTRHAQRDALKAAISRRNWALGLGLPAAGVTGYALS